MSVGLRAKISNKIPLLLYGIIILLPWQARYIFSEVELHGAAWEHATISLYIVDAFILLLLLLVFYVHEGVKRKLSKAVASLLLFFIYLVVLQTVSPFQNTAPTGVLYIVFALFLMMCFSFIIWDRKKIFLGLLAAGLWSGVIGLFHFFQGEVSANTILGIASQNPYELGVSVIDSGGVRLLRSYGSLSHPNMLGGLLVISIIASIALLSKYKDVLKRLFVLATIPVLTWSLFITFSRSAFIALIIALVISGMLIYYKGSVFERIYYLKGFIIVLVTLAVAMFTFSGEVASRFNGNRLEIKSINERVEAVPIAKKLFLKTPIFGTGFNTFTEAVATEDGFGKPAWAYQPVHNVDLLLLVELGLVGMVTLLILFIIYLKGFFSVRLTTDRVYILGMIIALSFISIFDHYLASSHFGLLLTVVVFSLAIEKNRIES